MSSAHVNLGVVGLGGWGKNVVRSFSRAQNCNLAYICDVNRGLLGGQQKLYPQAKAVDHYEQLLTDRSVDAIVVATPAPLHYKMVRDALLADKHVYVEKPMTLSSAEAEELVQMADDRGRKLMVGHLMEYHPGIALIKREIEEGNLGDIYYMYCQRLNLGVVRNNENAFWSLAPHDISIILYLFGSEPSEITAAGQCFLQRGIEDVVFVTLRFPDGRFAQIHVSWLDPHKERKVTIVGSQKMLVFDDMHPTEKIRIFNKGACLEAGEVVPGQGIGVRHGNIFIPHLPASEPLQIEAQHFVDAIVNDTVPRSDGRDGLRVVRILESVERQLRQGSKQESSFHRDQLKIYAA